MASSEQYGLQYEEFEDPAFDTFVEETMQEFHAPGMAVLVLHGDKIYAKGYGFSDLKHKIPVTPKILFFTGSTTKSFTSAMAAYLVESDDFPAIHWHTPMAEIIRDDFVLAPSSANGQWATNHVTIEDCLSHRTGLPRHELVWINGFTSNRDIVRSLRHVPMHREMRTKFEYCNNTYTAISHAVETVTQRPFKDLLKDHIFDPLELNATTYDAADATKITHDCEGIDMSKGYLWNKDTKDYEQVPLSDIPPSRGSGGIISNVLDYAHWVRHLMKPTNLNAALSDSAVNAMRTPRMLVDADPKKPWVGPEAYGLGLYSHVYRGRQVLEDAGAIAGYMANIMMVPPSAADIKQGKNDSGWAVVTMQNSYSVAQNVVFWHLLDKYLETPKDEHYDMAQTARDSIAEAEDALKEENIANRDENAPKTPVVNHALPLSAYEGVYEHPAYHKFEVSATPFTKDTSDKKADSARLYLRPPPSEKGFLALSATLHHINAEWWWALQQTGPRSWISDRILKVQFIIGASSKVEGMRYQAEPAMPDELAFFGKIA